MNNKSLWRCLLAAATLWAVLPANNTPGATPDPVAGGDRSAALAHPAALNSPKATVRAFVDSVHRAAEGEPQAWGDVYRCMDLGGTDHRRAREAALALRDVLIRLEPINDATPVPDAESVTRNSLTSYTYFPNDRFDPSILRQAKHNASITLVGSESGSWKFSASTLRGIHGLYGSLADMPVVAPVHDEPGNDVSLSLRRRMPRYLRTARILNLEYWQWLGLGLLVLLGLTLDQAVRFALRLATSRMLTRRRASASKESVAVTVRPLGLFSAGLLWLALVRFLNLPGPVLLVLVSAARLFTVLAGTWAAWCVTNLASEILSRKAASTTTKFDDVLIPLFRKTIKVLIVVFGLVYSAAALNIPVMPMVTSLGIGGLAFAFAAKDTIENFFGSVAVILDHPFEVGDWVVIGDVEGTVEEVGFRSTRIRTFYNSQVTLPNAMLVRATVDNFGRRRYRRVKTHIGIQYDTPPEKIVAFTEGIRELVRSHPYTRKDYFQVWFHEFGPSSLNILLYIFHETDDWSTELRERERLFLDITRLAQQLGVQFAFPTQTVHLYQGHSEQAPSTGPTAGADRDAATAGISTAQKLIQDAPWLAAKPGPVRFQGGPTRLDVDRDPIEDRSAGS